LVAPLVAAALAGMLVTQVAVFTAARRAARTKATEALREAAVEQRPVTRTRLVIGSRSWCRRSRWR
jgi:putative ABC transport system permease protein